MADAIIFPGTLMEVFEKYPDSRRLDHPDVADVRKTTFAKGVITDFQQIQDDPIQLDLVKVEIEGVGESEFIPFFFHPKALYWDGEDTEDLAQGFDEEKGCFNRAWMSFRVGDEVAVMLKEGVPVGVMGFTDGVPRVGEDVVKLETQSLHTPWDFEDWQHPDYPSRIGANWPDAFARMNKADFHDAGEKGPDDLDLKLLLEADRYDGPEETTGSQGIVSPEGSWTTGGPIEIDHNAPWGTYEYAEGDIYCETCGILYWENGNALLTKIALWTIKVGPLLYAIYGKFRESYSKSIAYIDKSPGPVFVGTLTRITHTYNITRLCVKAGIYKEGMEAELAATLGAYPDWNYLGGLSAPNWWPVEVEGMKLQTDLTKLLSYLCAFDAKSFDEVKWFARPHTKAELQEADMWPAGKDE